MVNPYQKAIDILLQSRNLGHDRMVSIVLSHLAALAQAWDEGYTSAEKAKGEAR